MKTGCRMLMVLLALGAIFSSASEALAQGQPVAGAYGETAVTESEVISAARYAVQRQSRKQGARISLISIRKAEVQVVSGLNYRLGLRVGVNGRTEDATAIVYKNLRGKYSLSVWEAEEPRAGSKSAPSFRTIEQLVDAVGSGFTLKELGKLDARRPYFGRVRIVIEHSLAGDNDKDRFEIKEFGTLEAGERWLRSREREGGLPARVDNPVEQCRRGVCTYNYDGGILHNHLYLKKILYGFRKGRPYIKTIYLLDGD